MITGSLASAFYGEPRSTQDLDVVVNAKAAELQALGARLRDEGLYCDSNAIDPATGWKVDFILLKDQPFHRAAFEARGDVELSGTPVRLIRA